jgi:hypothetical protein
MRDGRFLRKIGGGISIGDNKQNLLKLRGIFLDYGQKEEFSHIRISTTLFSKALADRGIPHVFEVYEGADHDSKIRERGGDAASSVFF